ncbi:MAG: phosphoribosylformylglycinamidine synthase [Desulfobulbus sp.]|nr:phosphoribosylformylglycinamidine synthase [Desulfobulbus sp.]
MATLDTQLHRRIRADFAYCNNVAFTRPLTSLEMERLRLILADGFILHTVTFEPQLRGERVVEVGPRLNFATALSSNLVSICQAVGLDCVTRVERSRRYLVPKGEDLGAFVARHHDRMTECPYPAPLTTFETGILPEPVYEVDLKSKGPDGLLDIPGISMDQWDRELYYDYFVKRSDRNPTIVEIMDLNNANSEHSRHGFFRGKQVIDGQAYEKTLFQVVTDTLDANPEGSLVAFKDNSSVIRGTTLTTLLPAGPGEPSPLGEATVTYHPLLTAETHNFPTGVAPFPGAETGTGGRIRDVQGTGRGGFVMAGTAGYCVANLHIPDYPLPWENSFACPDTLASALTIEIEASNGASDYGNKFGEPLVQGFTRSFDLRLESGERWGFLKPIMFTGGIGQIDDRHIEKKQAIKGMLIVQVGGPAYRVGFGGGAASSMLQGENESALDFNAVQRGDAEMEQKMNRVIRACNEMGDLSLIDVIHDQGAGGPANVLKELVEQAGGRVDIRNIRVGDPTMSVLEIYVAEYQERVGLLISPENIERFQAICTREKVACEVLGEVTGDLRFVVHDSWDNTTPVDIGLPELLGNIPQKTFTDSRVVPALSPFAPPKDLSLRDALHQVLRLVSVGSKRFLTSKVDRAVTGLVAQQQCCGPLQLTVADVAVVAQSHLGFSAIATAIGEQPIKMLVDPAAGARMAVGEALTNLVWARINDLDQVKCSANWMWAPKLPGEGAALRDAAEAMATAMITLGVAVDGGKDSLSMATRVGKEVVKSPRELVVSVYAAMADLRRKVTPDLKEADSVLLFIDLAGGKNRLGGSALAQTCDAIGSEVPDMEDPALVRRAFLAVQQLIADDLILSGHDRSDGGLITTVLEMAFAGNRGLNLALNGPATLLEALFNEELGLVVECRWNLLAEVKALLSKAKVPCIVLGATTARQAITIQYNGDYVLDDSLVLLRQWWEETSYQLDRLQMNPDCADEEKFAILDRKGPSYYLSFSPQPTAPAILTKQDKPRVAILRDEGSNSDREMASAFYSAGFEPWDLTMTDLLDGRIDLGRFRGLAAVGGFSYADVPESAKGWAATIRFNERLQEQFRAFYERPDTFTLGVCNGCQLFGLLGWVPWTGIEPERQPRFIPNRSNRFESRWSTVRVLPSAAIMLEGMEDLVFGIHSSHGEGLLHFPDESIRERVWTERMATMVYVDDDGRATDTYPFNPNGSRGGLTGLCSPDGRHLALMPHPERTFLTWQAPWLPDTMHQLPASPWLRMFQNAYEWCQQ